LKCFQTKISNFLEGARLKCSPVAKTLKIKEITQSLEAGQNLLNSAVETFENKWMEEKNEIKA